MESLNWKKLTLAALLVVAGSTQATQSNVLLGNSDYILKPVSISYQNGIQGNHVHVPVSSQNLDQGFGRPALGSNQNNLQGHGAFDRAKPSTGLEVKKPSIGVKKPIGCIDLRKPRIEVKRPKIFDPNNPLVEAATGTITGINKVASGAFSKFKEGADNILGNNDDRPNVKGLAPIVEAATGTITGINKVASGAFSKFKEGADNILGNNDDRTNVLGLAPTRNLRHW